MYARASSSRQLRHQRPCATGVAPGRRCGTLVIMFDQVASIFKSNCNEVERLLKFDQDVLAFVTNLLEGLHNDLKGRHASDQMNCGRILHMVRGVRDNDSLKGRYKTVHTQAVVLLVSHFASALGDIFRASIANRIDQDNLGDLVKKDLKLTIGDMRDCGWDLKDAVADLIIEKNDIKFQDMKSVVRAFKDYAGIELSRDGLTNDIILGQAARHIIVHDSGRISDKMLRQVANAKPRLLKTSLTLGETISFETEEVLLLMRQMQGYVERLVSALKAVQ